MRLQRGLAIAQALADEPRADQAGDARVDVDHGTAGEVDGTQLTQVAATPDDMCHRDVAEGEPQRREQQHRAELDALGEGTDDQRGGDAGKVDWNATNR